MEHRDGQYGEAVQATYLTAGQAAARLGISKRTLLRAVARGALCPAYQTPGGHHRFAPRAIESYAGVRAGVATPHRRRTTVTTPAPTASVDARRVVAAATAGLVVLDGHGWVIDANPAAAEMLGRPLAALQGQPLAQVAPMTFSHNGAMPSREEQPVPLAVRTGQPVDGAEMQVVAPDGTCRRLRVDIIPLRDQAGAVAHVVVSLTDITAHVQAEQALHASEATFRTLIERAPVAACIVSRDGVYELVNDAYCALVGYPAAQLLGRSLGYTLPVAMREEVARRFGSGGRGLWAGEVTILNAAGEERTVIISRMGIVGADGQPRLVCFLMDITERKRLEEHLAHLAHHDPLTGLPNRALFAARLTHALDTVRRTGHLLAVCVLDLDRFKWVNDALGHEAGDALLRCVGERLAAVLRNDDMVARLGGDEFALLLPDTDAAGSLYVAATVVAALARPVDLHGQSITVGGSVGVVHYPMHGQDAVTLLRHADAAMYVAKRRGGGVVLYAPGADAGDEPFAQAG